MKKESKKAINSEGTGLKLIWRVCLGKKEKKIDKRHLIIQFKIQIEYNFQIVTNINIIIEYNKIVINIFKYVKNQL